MIPTAYFKIIVDIPKGKPEYAAIVNAMRESVGRLLDDAVKYAQGEAPGDTLKHQITYTKHQTPDGLVGEIWIPYQLKFTFPPGTKPHLIPGGSKVSSLQEAATLQMHKGYPLRFYWEQGPRGPGMYFYWAVQHPGFKGGDWVERMMKYLALSFNDESDFMMEFIMRQWGAGVEVVAGIGL